MTKFNVQYKAEKLVLYIFLITLLSAKKFRTDMASQLRNKSLEMIENLVRGNSCAIDNEYATKESIKRRDRYQKELLMSIKVLNCFLDIAFMGKVITSAQLKYATKLSSELYDSVIAWINSDIRRLNKNKS